MNFVQGENEVKVATLVVSHCIMNNELMNEDFHQLGYRFKINKIKFTWNSKG